MVVLDERIKCPPLPRCSHTWACDLDSSAARPCQWSSASSEVLREASTALPMSPWTPSARTTLLSASDQLGNDFVMQVSPPSSPSPHVARTLLERNPWGEEPGVSSLLERRRARLRTAGQRPMEPLKVDLWRLKVPCWPAPVRRCTSDGSFSPSRKYSSEAFALLKRKAIQALKLFQVSGAKWKRLGGCCTTEVADRHQSSQPADRGTTEASR